MIRPVKKRAGGIVLILLLVVAVVFFTVIFPNTSPQKYKRANEYLLEARYTDAAAIFLELGDYEDAPRLLKECRYGEATVLQDIGNYREALTAYEALGDYGDSPDRILQCYFVLGQEAFTQENYEEAIACFLQAGDHPDVRAELDKAYYELGHRQFLKGMYIPAKEKFDQIQIWPEYAEPHFQFIEDATEYLAEKVNQLAEEISIYVIQSPLPPPGDSLWDLVSNYVPFQSGSAYYDNATKTLHIKAFYHPGMRILRAWEAGDTSMLSEEELQALQVAQDLVAQAQAQSDDPLEVELFFYNWLCENVSYESPDMDVDEEAYLQLRQLSCVGALLDGKANCQGYTDAFYLLGNMAGFEVCKISGTGDWEPHTWNGIELDDKLYLVDVTFGDVDAMGQYGKTYVWFNCAYDPETYTIDGGEEIFPDLVMENDLSQTYYHDREAVFASVGDAAYYLLRQYQQNGEGFAFAMVEGQALENADLNRALENNYRSAGVYSYSCTWVLQTYNGNTYITIQWE